jgi:predicted TIM-barrel fold metal-dependent hydrolase
MAQRIIDVHAHVGISSTLQVAGSADDVVRLMDDNGIDQSVISPIPGYEDPRGVEDSVQQNDNIARAIKDHPDRLPCGLGVVEPRHGAAALDEVDRVMSHLGLRGLMFHNDFNGLSIDSPAMFRILDRLAAHDGAIAQVHTAQHSVLEAPYQLGTVADAFPGITFINAHPFMDGTQLRASIDLGRRHPTMLFDTTVSHHHLWPIEKAVEGIGEDRLMFGSDNPYYTFTADIDIINYAQVTEEVRDKVFWRNAARVFGLE